MHVRVAEVHCHEVGAKGSQTRAREAGRNKGGQQGSAECGFRVGNKFAEGFGVELGDGGNAGCRHLLQVCVGTFVGTEFLDACIEHERARGEAQCSV